MNFLSVAVQAAHLAGKIHLKYFHSKDLHIRTKSSAFDRVTIADTESERVVVEHIRKHFPDHNFLGEEGKYEKTDSPYTWVIDPVDGTNNFSKGYPFFCVSIAVAKGTEILAGAIFDVLHGELFTAEKGKGAKLNGRKIRVSDGKTIGQSLLITGFYYDRGTMVDETLEQIRTVLKKGTLGVRRSGSAALDLCYVASGRADGFWELKLSPWDYAAGKLIVLESGGKVTDRYGKPLTLEQSSVVATNGKIHTELISVVKMDSSSPSSQGKP